MNHRQRPGPLQVAGQACRAPPDDFAVTEAADQLAQVRCGQLEIQPGLRPAAMHPDAPPLEAPIRILQLQVIEHPGAAVVARLKLQFTQRPFADSKVVDAQVHARQAVEWRAAGVGSGSRRVDRQAFEIAFQPALAGALPDQITKRLAGIEADLPAVVARSQGQIDLMVVAAHEMQLWRPQGNDAERQGRRFAARASIRLLGQEIAPGIGIDARRRDTHCQAALGQTRLGIANRQHRPLPEIIAAQHQALADTAQGDPVLLTSAVRRRALNPQR